MKKVITVCLLLVTLSLAKFNSTKLLTRCGKHFCVPNLNLVNQGIDMVTGEFRLPPYATTKGNKAIRNHITGKTWGYFNEHRCTFINEAIEETILVENSKKFEDHIKERTSVGVDIGPWFSASAEVKQVRSVTRGSSYQYGKTEQYFGSYRFLLILSPSELKPSNSFKAMLKSLPEEYDERKYVDAIKKFGTHYMTEVVLGGRGQTENTIKSSYVKQYTSTEAKIQAKAEFWFFKAHAEHERDRRTGSQNFNKNSVTRTSFKGGKASSFKLKDWQDWAKTIDDAPQIMDFKVRRISDMIGNERKKANYYKAMLQYLKDTAIPE
eukprot:gene6390-10397_t